MKEIYGILLGMITVAASADDMRNNRFKKEITDGLNTVRIYRAYDTNVNWADIMRSDSAGKYGELGYEVFYEDKLPDSDEYRIFVPGTTYVRMGGGLNIGSLTSDAHFGKEKHASKGSWTTLIGLGWNWSSYVRGEVNFQESAFKFSDLSDMNADFHMLNGMVYFDFARRYVTAGDITYRRTFIPFMGVGVGMGQYSFNGSKGRHGFAFAAPRAELGMTFMLTDTIGLDIAYQYQMMMGNGFGWDTGSGGVNHISNALATVHVNF